MLAAFNNGVLNLIYFLGTMCNPPSIRSLLRYQKNSVGLRHGGLTTLPIALTGISINA